MLLLRANNRRETPCTPPRASTAAVLCRPAATIEPRWQSPKIPLPTPREEPRHTRASQQQQQQPFLTKTAASSSSLMYTYTSASSASDHSLGIPAPPSSDNNNGGSSSQHTEVLAPWKEDPKQAALFRAPSPPQTTTTTQGQEETTRDESSARNQPKQPSSAFKRTAAIWKEKKTTTEEKPYTKPVPVQKKKQQAVTKSPPQTNDGKDPYEWAYAVWRRKGLLADNKKCYSTKKASSDNNNTTAVMVDPPPKVKVSPHRRPSRHSLPATLSVSTTRSGEKRHFNDVMSKWRAKSEAAPALPDFLSPTAEEVAVTLFPINCSKHNSDEDDDRRHYQSSAMEGSNSRNEDTADAAATANPVVEEEEFPAVNRQIAPRSSTVTALDVSVRGGGYNQPPQQRNPAASIPLDTQEPSPSPVRKVPQSQAWKLKWGASSQTAMEKKRRESMPAALPKRQPKTFKSLPKSRGDYKSAVQDFLLSDGSHAAATLHETVNSAAVVPLAVQQEEETMAVDNEQSQQHPDSSRSQVSMMHRRKNLDSTRSQASSRHRRQWSDESSGFSPFLPPPTATSAATSMKASNDFNRSKSMPRHRHLEQSADDGSATSPSSISSIRSHLQKESDAMRESLASPTRTTTQHSKSKPADFSPNKSSPKEIRSPIRVKDLVIEQYGINSTSDRTDPLEVQYSSSKKPNEAAADFISPYGKTVMKKLEKAAANKKDETITPREEAFSDRPWQHDRLLRRVEGLTDEQRNPTASSSAPTCRCTCSDSLFSGNDEMIEFFLPLTGTACTCGKSQGGLKEPNDPTSLVNILRSWQIEFLGSFGIYRGEDLVKANHRSASALASALRQYRKKMGMTPFRTKSCVTALQIWSKTSKAFVRSIRNQTESHTEKADLRAPNNLYILSSFLESVPDDGSAVVPATVTTSSCCSGSPSSSFRDDFF